jgi:predicted HAD superfamily Cof-like phosphohydrolase
VREAHDYALLIEGQPVFQMIVVLEGVDACGKSTLARRLSAVLGWPIQSSEGPEKYPGEANDRIRRYLSLDRTIFDRHPCISQQVYCQVNGTQSVDPALLRIFYASKPLLIYCQAPAGRDLMAGHVEKAHDSPQHLQAIKAHAQRIQAHYECWALKHAHVLVRWGDDYQALEATIRALLGETFEPMADVEAFHRKFNLGYLGRPRVLPAALADFRERFMREELTEYEQNAAGAQNELGHSDLFNPDEANLTFHLEEMLDALVDLTYVVLGTSIYHGFNFREAWRRVHAANMKKIKAVNEQQSVRKSLHDVVKPDGWQPPSHADLVENHIHRSAPKGD